MPWRLKKQVQKPWLLETRTSNRKEFLSAAKALIFSENGTGMNPPAAAGGVLEAKVVDVQLSSLNEAEAADSESP